MIQEKSGIQIILQIDPKWRIIGKNGWDKIIDFQLNDAEQTAFDKSAAAVRSMNDVLKTL